MHLKVHGPEADEPTVVLEAGMGSFSPNWYWVRGSLQRRSEASRTIGQGLAGAGRAGSRAMHRRLRSSYTMLYARQT